MFTASLRLALRAAVVSLLCISFIAEAGLIRGGGRGARTIIEVGTASGSVPFLIQDPKLVEQPLLPPDDGGVIPITEILPAGQLATTLTATDLANAAAYGYGPSSFPISASHSWGRECSLAIQCAFELEPGETLDWMGHIVGLPPVRPATQPYDAVADLVVTWDLFSLKDFEGGVVIVGQDGQGPAQHLMSWSSTFEADTAKTGNYLPGTGSPSVILGESIAYADAVASSESDSSCFATSPGKPINSLPPTLPINQAYAYGECREIKLDLGAGPSPFTGADLDALLSPDPRDFLYLILSVDLIAPTGYEFANLIEDGAPFLSDAVVPDVVGLSSPNGLRSTTDPIRYVECTSTNCETLFSTNSFGLRIDVNSVPSPASAWLLALGISLIFHRRRRYTARR